MAVAGNQYVPVRPKQFPKSRDALTVDAKFWRSFKGRSSPQQIGAVTCVQFCPAPPHDFAVTSSTRVTVYDGKTCEVKKVISRFTDVAYSGTFRADGQLIVAGGETGVIQVFDAGSRTILRHLKGHKRAVHWVRYSPLDKLHVLSASDDNSVRWWDVAGQGQLLKMEEHTDYVRCGTSSPASTDIWATGSYDHSVRVWDVRTAKSILQIQHQTQSGAASDVNSVDCAMHEAPLEDVLFFPTGGLLATAGGNLVKIWDILGGGKLLHVLGSHQKAVTKLCFTAAEKSSGSSSRLLTASLDGHVKVFELENYKVTHAAKYPDPLLSMDISPSCATMAVGMSSGKLIIRQRPMAIPEEQASTASSLTSERSDTAVPKKGQKLRPSASRYFSRGAGEKASDDDYFVARMRGLNMAKYDKFLRQFRFRDALRAALETSDPAVVVAVMEELVARRRLISAISNLDAAGVDTLLRFLSRQTTIPRYSQFLIPVALKVLDTHANVLGSSPSAHHWVSLLKERVGLEMKLQLSLRCLQGVIQPLMHASLQP